MPSKHFLTFSKLTCPSLNYAARILRAIRIASRLGFRISKETAHFVKNLSLSVLRLDKVIINLFHCIV